MMDGLDIFYTRAHAPVSEPAWFFFLVTEDGVTLCPPSEMAPRPADAQPDHGNPYTPWYQTVEHWDADHIHIKALSTYTAVERAKRIYMEHIHGCKRR
jgi:hypothetical protein